MEKADVALRVEDVMITEVITIDENASVKDAANIMNKYEIGSLIAVRKGKAIGIITERDLLKRVIVDAKNAKKTKVSEAMSSPLEVIAAGTDLEEAIRLMFQKKIKKLPKRSKISIGFLIIKTKSFNQKSFGLKLWIK